MIAGDGRHQRIKAKPADIVDHFRAWSDRQVCYGLLLGVDGDGNRTALSEKLLNDRNDASQFFLSGDRIGSGTGGLAADIDDACPLASDLKPSLNRGCLVEVNSSVGEGIR